MSFNLTLANGKTCLATADQTILVSAEQHGLVLEHSCRTGRCGVCKARVLNGETLPLKPEEFLTEEQRAQGYILTCCRSVCADVQLDIEDIGEMGRIRAKVQPCRIDSLQLLSDDVMEVILRTPPSSSLEYLPGQYVDIIGKNGLRRSYSIANAPREDGKISLQIRKVVDGQMSNYWFSEAQANDLLRMEGPLGTFFLRKGTASQLVFLATGTGIAPVKAILEQMAAMPELNTYSHIHLYWGGRTEQDIYWQPEFSDLPLSFTPVLSRAIDWKGARGHVQQAVIADGIDLSRAVVYACGSPIMIRDAQDALIAAGLDEKRFYSDAFVSSS